MAKGRKPKPTALKVLAGNPGKRKLNDREPNFETGSAETPPELLDEKHEIARSEWCRVCPLLIAAGVYTDIDRTALIAYCLTYERWILAERKIERDGLFVRTDKGYVMASQEMRTIEASIGVLRSLMSEFGMTPASRARLQVDRPGGGTGSDPLEEFRNRAAQRSS